MEFVKVELRHDNHKVGINYWHVEFTTKYRYQMFAKFDYKNLISACIRKSANAHNIQIHVMNVMPEHVHVLVTLPKGMLPEGAFRFLKGASSFYFFKNHPKARLRYPHGHLWSRGGCAVTVGYNQFSETEHYILNQAEHHGLASS
jgi:putative transposase